MKMCRGSSHARQVKKLCHSESRTVCLKLTKQNKQDLFRSSCPSSGKVCRRCGWCAFVRAKSSSPATKRKSRRNERAPADGLKRTTKSGATEIWKKQNATGRKEQPEMNYDLKTTQTELAERKAEEIFNFLSRNCARPQPPRDLRRPAVLRPGTS